MLKSWNGLKKPSALLAYSDNSRREGLKLHLKQEGERWLGNSGTVGLGPLCRGVKGGA